MTDGTQHSSLHARPHYSGVLLDDEVVSRQRSHVMMMQGGCDAGGMVAQAPFQRTALQLVHRHDHVELIHGCVMTRACSRQSRVVYGKLFWTMCTTGETSHALPCGTTPSAATVVRPDALPCTPFFWVQRGPSAQARRSFRIALFAFGGS